VARWAVSAFGRPDALWRAAEVTDVGRDRGTDLSADALVGAQQRHVAVGRAGGKDLDHARFLKAAEAGDDLAIEGAEVVQGRGKKAMPEARGLCEVGFPCLDEEGFVFARGDDLAREVLGEFGDEGGVGELLQQDGRKVDVEVRGDAVALQVGEHAQ